MGLSDVFYWVITIGDEGQTIPQFDYETGKVNKITSFPKNIITKIAWYPFTQDIINKIKSAGIDTSNFIINPFLPKYEINIPENAYPVIEPMKEGWVDVISFQKCLKCGYEFKFNPKEHKTVFVKHMGRKTITCPNCGGGDEFVCSNCGFATRDNTDYPEICPECGKKAKWKFKRNIVNQTKIERHMIYKLGYVQNGQLHGITIKENGDVVC